VTIAAWMSAIPVAAQAPAVTTFDGTYVGVSRTVEKKEGCLQGKPFPDGPLTIAGGVARYPSLAFMPGSPKGRGTFEGRVNGEGKLFMRGADEISDRRARYRHRPNTTHLQTDGLLHLPVGLAEAMKATATSRLP
jgi:hypothetical protein